MNVATTTSPPSIICVILSINSDHPQKKEKKKKSFHSILRSYMYAKKLHSTRVNGKIEFTETYNYREKFSFLI